MFKTLNCTPIDVLHILGKDGVISDNITSTEIAVLLVTSVDANFPKYDTRRILHQACDSKVTQMTVAAEVFEFEVPEGTTSNEL